MAKFFYQSCPRDLSSLTAPCLLRQWQTAASWSWIHQYRVLCRNRPAVRFIVLKFQIPSGTSFINGRYFLSGHGLEIPIVNFFFPWSGQARFFCVLSWIPMDLVHLSPVSYRVWTEWYHGNCLIRLKHWMACSWQLVDLAFCSSAFCHYQQFCPIESCINYTHAIYESTLKESPGKKACSLQRRLQSILFCYCQGQSRKTQA